MVGVFGEGVPGTALSNDDGSRARAAGPEWGRHRAEVAGSLAAIAYGTSHCRINDTLSVLFCLHRPLSAPGCLPRRRCLKSRTTLKIAPHTTPPPVQHGRSVRGEALSLATWRNASPSPTGEIRAASLHPARGVAPLHDSRRPPLVASLQPPVRGQVIILGLSDFQDNPFPPVFTTLSVHLNPPSSPGQKNRRTSCRTVQESVQNVAPVRAAHRPRRQTPRNPASFKGPGDWHGGCLVCWQCSRFGSKEAGPRGRRHAPSTASDLPAQ